MSKTQAFVRLDDGKVTIEEDWFLPFEDLIERNTPMKYMLMMSATKDVFDWYSNWPKEDLHANAAFMQSFNKELKDEGVLVATAGLSFPGEAKIVHAGRDGKPMVTDGPFAETKEFLAGYWIVEVESAEEAYRIAARASAAPAPAGTPGTMPIEVRQVMGGASG